MSQFTHLHVHSDASTLDGLGTVEALIRRAKFVGQSAVAITDHGTLSNSISFTVEAEAAGVKPIIGLEGYIEYDGTVGHITILADGDRGWRSLVNLNNLAQRSPGRRPSFTVDQLVTNSDDLVCLTGCIASPLHRLGHRDAIKLGSRLKLAFGHRLFAEVMVVDDSESWERALLLGDELSIRPVLTNDVHFCTEQQGEVHPILTSIKGGFDYFSKELWLKSGYEMIEAALKRGVPLAMVEAMATMTVKIGEKIKPVGLSSRTVKLPVIGAESSLTDMVLTVLKESHSTKEYVERATYELSVIESMGYSDYFYILQNIVNWAKSKGIKVGPGRGSGAGSLVAYLLGITGVDPIKYNLPFERFLNPDRVGMPDIDVDFETNRRDEVLKYAAKNYKALPIATYSRYNHKSLVRDLGKQLSISKVEVDDLADGDQTSKKFTQVTRDNPLFLRAYSTMLGQIRHKGKHPGGVIITDQLVPLEKVGGQLVSGWTEGGKSELTYAGIVKFDLLGLSTLSTLAALERRCGVSPPEPEDDSPVFEIFRSGRLFGVFQFTGSEGIRQLTMRLSPSKFMDIVAINALYRPGTLDAGVADLFVDWKDKPRYVPKLFRACLADTYGAIVFQEQMMEVYRLAVGGTWAEADNARRIIANYNKHPDSPEYIDGLRGLKESFIIGLTNDHRFKQGVAEEWWAEIETHARYSFNRAHATAYSMIAWQCAWFKYHYPTQFYCETLNTDLTRQQQYVFEAVQDGIEVVPPRLNVSSGRWETDGFKLYAPLTAVARVGPAAATAIVDEVNRRGNFSSVGDFMARVPKNLVRANARLNLLRVGAFYPLISTDAEVVALGLDRDKVLEAQRQPLSTVLGFSIPSVELVKMINSVKSTFDVVGMIVSSDKRKSKYGPYTVYRTIPGGSFWTRDGVDVVETLSVGTVVGVDINTKTGRVRRMSILEGAH